jgi:hypothetical protein
MSRTGDSSLSGRALRADGRISHLDIRAVADAVRPGSYGGIEKPDVRYMRSRTWLAVE